MLCHGLRGIRRGVRHHYAAPLRFRHIDNVVARRRHADIFHLRTRRHHVRRNLRLVGQNDLRIADKPRHVCLRRAIVNRHIAKRTQRVKIQLSRAEGIPVQNDNLF